MLVSLVGFTLFILPLQYRHVRPSKAVQVPLHAAEILAKCRLLEVKPGPPADFRLRERSDRFVPGTRPVLIKASE